MKVLILAPHPFYQERGTPIAVDLLIRALSERGDDVDLLTFHEGVDHSYPGFHIFRIKPWPTISMINATSIGHSCLPKGIESRKAGALLARLAAVSFIDCYS